MTEAYRSALELSFDVRAGLVMRQIHHWAALLFLAALAVHLARVFFTGAFRRPRELNWVIGCTLLILALLNGLFGYSLLDDQLSGTGLRIVYSVTLSIPLVGTWLASLLFGGEFPGPDIIQRLYVIHILLVPAAIAVLLTAHLAILVRQKHTQFSGARPARGQRGGRADVADVRGQGPGAVLPHVGGVGVPGRGVPDQPDLDLRPLRPGPGVGRQPARLVHGVARRGAAHHARLGAPGGGFEVPNPFFPGVLLAGLTFGLLYAGRSSRPGSPATTTSTTCSTVPASARCAPPWAQPRSPST